MFVYFSFVLSLSPGVFVFGRIVLGWQIGVNVKIVEQFRDGPLVLAQLLLHLLPGIAPDGQATVAAPRSEHIPQVWDSSLRRHGARGIYHGFLNPPDGCSCYCPICATLLCVWLLIWTEKRDSYFETAGSQNNEEDQLEIKVLSTIRPYGSSDVEITKRPSLYNHLSLLDPVVVVVSGFESFSFSFMTLKQGGLFRKKEKKKRTFPFSNAAGPHRAVAAAAENAPSHYALQLRFLF